MYKRQVLATLISSGRLELPRRKRSEPFTVDERVSSGLMIYTVWEQMLKNPS